MAEGPGEGRFSCSRQAAEKAKAYLPGPLAARSSVVFGGLHGVAGDGGRLGTSSPEPSAQRARALPCAAWGREGAAGASSNPHTVRGPALSEISPGLPEPLMRSSSWGEANRLERPRRCVS